jgi:hypothetical protein
MILLRKRVVCSYFMFAVLPFLVLTHFLSANEVLPHDWQTILIVQSIYALRHMFTPTVPPKSILIFNQFIYILYNI